MSNKNALSSYAQHSNPMSMMGPAAVSTLQRKPSESVNETNLSRQKSFDPFTPSTNSDVINAMSAKSVNSLLPINHVSLVYKCSQKLEHRHLDQIIVPLHNLVC